MQDEKQEQLPSDQLPNEEVTITRTKWTPDHPKLPAGLSVISLSPFLGKSEKPGDEAPDNG